MGVIWVTLTFPREQLKLYYTQKTGTHIEGARESMPSYLFFIYITWTYIQVRVCLTQYISVTAWKSIIFRKE